MEGGVVHSEQREGKLRAEEPSVGLGDWSTAGGSQAAVRRLSKARTFLSPHYQEFKRV